MWCGDCQAVDITQDIGCVQVNKLVTGLQQGGAALGVVTLITIIS